MRRVLSFMPTRPADVYVAFDHETEAPRVARHAVAELFAHSNDDPIADAVLLTVSELVANVVMHTDDGGVLQAWDRDSDRRLRIEVEDHSRAAPVVAGKKDVETTGLLIVDRFANAWGVSPTPTGKKVWAEFHRLF